MAAFNAGKGSRSTANFRIQSLDNPSYEKSEEKRISLDGSFLWCLGKPLVLVKIL